MEPSESGDLEKFLRNIDQISELVKELNSTDVATQEKALEKAGHFAACLEEEKTCKTLLNRTVINTSPSHHSGPTTTPYEHDQTPEDFMKALEEDAQERRRRRQEKEERAEALKEKGNKAFALGDYEVAVRFYSEGLEQLGDVQVLYTNRAQAFIKLEKYQEAVSDCEGALKCNEKCIKALVHMGRAHLALKNFTESRLCYKRILEIEPERETLVTDYLTQVDLEEKKSLQEQTAREELKEGKEGATSVPDLLKKLDRSRELNLYYCGGVELLSEAIKDSTGQTLFRLNNGFSIIAGNSIVRSCLEQTSEEPYGEELCVSVLRLWRVVCCGNEENQQLLLQSPHTREQTVRFLASPVSAVQQASLALFCMFSETRHGRRLLIESLSLYRMVENLMDCVCKDVASGTMALTVLENLAGEKKFRTQSRGSFAEVLAPRFERLLGNISAASQELLPSVISVVGTMCQDEAISNMMAAREAFWKSSFSAMELCASCEYRSILYPLLGLMINIASNPAPALQERAVPTCSRCVFLLSDPDGGVITRAAGLLSVVLPKSAAATQEVVQQGVVKKLLRILKGTGQTSCRYSIKALAVCTASSQQARQDLVKFDKRLVTLRKLVGSGDEVVVGNAALCLGLCVEVQGAAAALLGTDCVLLLLRHAAGSSRRAAVQQNAAIALGKLCKAEPRHLVKLRELHGLEILHSCMKLIS